jgi:hypothetical protein
MNSAQGVVVGSTLGTLSSLDVARQGTWYVRATRNGKIEITSKAVSSGVRHIIKCS